MFQGNVATPASKPLPERAVRFAWLPASTWTSRPSAAILHDEHAEHGDAVSRSFGERDVMGGVRWHF